MLLKMPEGNIRHEQTLLLAPAQQPETLGECFAELEGLACPSTLALSASIGTHCGKTKRADIRSGCFVTQPLLQPEQTARPPTELSEASALSDRKTALT